MNVRDVPVRDYIRAIIIVAVAAAVRLVLGRLFGVTVPFVTFYPAVILVVLICGTGPALLSILLSGLTADFLFLQPMYSFKIEATGDIVALALFYLSGLILTVIAARLGKVRVLEARQESAEALRRYQLLAGDSRDIILFVRRRDGRILEANQAATKAYGYSDEELLSLTIYDLRGQERSLADSQMDKAGSAGILFETDHLRKDGTTFPVEVSSQGVFIGSDPVLLSVIRDITERKRAEEAVRESEARFSKAFYGSPSAMTITRPSDQTLIEANDSFLKLFEYSREEAIGRRVVADLNVYLNPEADRAKLVRLFEENGRVPNLEVRMRTKTGKILTVLFSSEMINFAGEGNVACSTIMDITEHKRMEEELRKSHDELELRVQERTEALRRQADLLELAHNTILVRDMDSRITFWNRAAEELYGWTKAEAVGKVTRSLLKTEFPVSFAEHMAVLTRRGHWEGELRHTTKDGRRIVVASRQALQRDNTGNAIAIMEINLDVTDHRRLERQFHQAQKMEALGTLSGGIAHDFNNILAAIIGFTELLQDHLPENSKERRSTRRVLEAGLRGRDLVRQMLTFSRQTEQEKKPLRLSGIVEETVRLLRASIPSTVSIKVSVKSESGVIMGDPVQIQQVLMNLATNAAYAMREKGGTLDIELSDFSIPRSNGDHGMEPGFYMKLVVRDTGSGIPPEVIDKIFDPFFTTKKQGEGTGLGLSVVMGIVKQSGGYITAESEPGKGSTFTAYFPKVEETPVTDHVGGQTIPTGQERILFVDDEEALIEMGEDLLAELGYEVVCRTGSREALALFRLDPSRFDVVITDQTMPDMTGLELARAIMNIRPETPVIMTTGFSHLVDADSAKAAGIKGFVMKPLTKRELATTVRRVLDGESE